MISINNTDIDKIKIELLDILEKYEKKYGVRFHISNWRYDHLTDKTDFDITLYAKTIL